MFRANRVHGNRGVDGTPPNPEGNNQKRIKLSHAPEYSKSFTSKVAEGQNAQEQFERGVIFPPRSHNSTMEHALRQTLIKQQQLTTAALPSTGVPEQVAASTVASTSTSSMSLLGTSTDEAQTASSESRTSGEPLWTPESFARESAKHDWCKDLDEPQATALFKFMNRARVSSLDDVGAALPPTLFGSLRLAFEAACAVYASGVGDITEQDDDGNTCLHMMVRVHDPDAVRSAWADIEASQGVPPLELHERFAETIRLGADPFVKNKAGKSTIDLASDHGCLDDLIRGMSESLPQQAVDQVLAWKDAKKRNILSAMASVSGDGLAEVRKLVARKFCEDFAPKLTFEIATQDRADWETLQQKVRGDWDHQLDNRQVAAVARFMKEAKRENAAPSEVADALPLALTTGLRPAFEAARAVYASGVCDIKDHTCLHDLSLSQKPSARVWGYKAEEQADVGIEERLAVMMQLGADPFSTGVDGKLRSAEQLAIERDCEALNKPFADLKSTLKMMTGELDEKLMSAWGNATSAEAVDFFQDLGVKKGQSAFDCIQSPIAINRWLRRNPEQIENSLDPEKLRHPLRGASAQVIAAYVDAIKTRPSFDANYQGDVNFDLKSALGWSKTCSQFTRHNPGNATLFNCSSSIESAKTLLVARISAKPGDLHWDDYCACEWRYLLGNVEDTHSDQHVSSVELAALLMEHGVFPPNDVLSGAAEISNWKLMREKVNSRNEATNLWGKVIQGEKSATELSKSEWAVMAPHAHRMLADVPFEQFKSYMLPLANHVASTTKCDQTTRIAFLKASYQGLQALGDAKTKEDHRAVWNQVVGHVGNTFRYRERGTSLSGAGILGEARKYVIEQSDDAHRSLSKKK